MALILKKLFCLEPTPYTEMSEERKRFLDFDNKRGAIYIPLIMTQLISPNPKLVSIAFELILEHFRFSFFVSFIFFLSFCNWWNQFFFNSQMKEVINSLENVQLLVADSAVEAYNLVDFIFIFFISGNVVLIFLIFWKVKKTNWRTQSIKRKVWTLALPTKYKWNSRIFKNERDFRIFDRIL